MSVAGREMTPSEVEAFLAEPRHAVVATIRRDGSAQMSPVWFLYEAGRLHFYAAASAAKRRNLERDPRITVCVDAGHPDARFVTVHGTAEIAPAGAGDAPALAWRITRRYLDSDEAATRYREALAGRPEVLITVTPGRVIAMDYD